MSFSVLRFNCLNNFSSCECYSSCYNTICEYQYLNPNFDDTKEESESNKYYCMCESDTFSSKINDKGETYNDTKNYCYQHKTIPISIQV